MSKTREAQEYRIKKELNSKIGWFVVLFYGVSAFFRLFNAELNFKQFSLVYV